MKYTLLFAERMAYPLSVVCWVLGVTHSGFHAWRGRAPSMREQERHQLSASIGRVLEDNCSRYGAPRIYRVLCERDGYTGSLNSIQTPMRAMRLCATAGKKYKVTTDSAHSLSIALNLPGQDFSCDASAESTSPANAPES